MDLRSEWGSLRWVRLPGANSSRFGKDGIYASFPCDFHDCPLVAGDELPVIPGKPGIVVAGESEGGCDGVDEGLGSGAEVVVGVNQLFAAGDDCNAVAHAARAFFQLAILALTPLIRLPLGIW